MLPSMFIITLFYKFLILSIVSVSALVMHLAAFSALYVVIEPKLSALKREVDYD